jgi:FhuF 2Fe-2S C-terminal domain
MIPDPATAELRGRLAALGPFFAVEVHDGAAPSGAWVPLSRLIHSDGDGDCEGDGDGDREDGLRARVEAAREVLASGSGRRREEVPIPVAASVMQLGLAARVVSPVLALAALGGVDRVPAVADLYWRPEPGSAVPLSVPSRLLSTAGSEAAPLDEDRWAAAVVTGPLTALSRATAALCPSEHVRHGNLASAVHGAVTVLRAAPPGVVGEDEAHRAQELARRLLEQPTLRGASTGLPGTSDFRRRNCCLIYRVAATAPAAGKARAICGDCVLGGPAAAR